jgi:hypothetical protein
MIQRMMVCARGQDYYSTRSKGTHGHDKGVRHRRGRICELVCELDVMVVEPSAGNWCYAVIELHPKVNFAIPHPEKKKKKRTATLDCANRPVSRFPTTPPMACDAKIYKKNKS